MEIHLPTIDFFLGHVSFRGGIYSSFCVEVQVQESGQIIATSHDQNPQKVAFGKGNGTPKIYENFREIPCW